MTRLSARRPVSVGIIGAGLAGLRCADVLLQHGCNVSIYEARSRLGGRVAQSERLGFPIDLGPNWIHGSSEENPIMALAKETDTILCEPDEEQYIVDVDGSPWSSADADECTRIFWDDGLVAEAFRYSREQNDLIDPSASLFDFFEERILHMYEDLPSGIAQRKRQQLLDMATVWGTYVGESVGTQSLKYFWLEECIEGENLFVANTYREILAVVSRAARERASIHLETVIAHVHAIDRHTDDAARPRVHTVDGRIMEHDEVVVTTPLGWLKRHPDFFQPPPPPQLSDAIASVGYGALDKIYLRFASAFWHCPSSPPSPFATTTSPFPGAMHWLPPTYAPTSNPQQWDMQAMDLAAMPGACAQPTLLFYIYGDCSRHVARLVSTAPDAATCERLLCEFLAPYYTRLPGWNKSSSACRPVGALATAWAGDEFAGYGSYSNFPVGLTRGDEHVATMRRGLPERGVWLAGEHTAPVVGLGTTTGAYWSGENVAERIVEKYNLEGAA